MRRILVFVLRVLLDSDTPETLRGSVVLVPEGQPRQFTSEQALLEVLAEMTRPCSEQDPEQKGGNGEKQP